MTGRDSVSGEVGTEMLESLVHELFQQGAFTAWGDVWRRLRDPLWFRVGYHVRQHAREELRDQLMEEARERLMELARKRRGREEEP